MKNNQLKVSVIIPFYQEQKGLLRKAVYSVLDQDFKCKIDIIIIDNDSPTPAYPECEDLQYEKDRINIQIIKQKNRSLSTTLNLGIKSTQCDTDFLAILDSSDYWTNQHLDSIFTYKKNFELYFCHHMLQSMLQKVKNMISLNYKISFPFHERSQKIENTDILQYEGDTTALALEEIFRFTLSGFIINYNHYKNTCFDEKITVNEHTMILTTLLIKTKNVIYSERINVFCKEDYISFPRLDDPSISLRTWNDSKFLTENSYKTVYYKTILSLIKKASPAKENLYTNDMLLKISENCNELSACFIHNFFHLKQIPWGSVYSIIIQHPPFLMITLHKILKNILNKMKTPLKTKNESTPPSKNIHHIDEYREIVPVNLINLNNQMKIPRIFHRIWIVFQEEKPEIPEIYMEFDSELKDLHPNWTFMEWNASKIEKFIAEYYPNFLETWKNYDQPVKRHDSSRYLILKHYGGVFIQHSIKLFKNIEPLLQGHEAVFSEQSKFDHTLANSFLSMTPQHPIFDDIEDKLKQNAIIQDPIIATGPLLITTIVHKYLDNNKEDNIKILPTQFLYPFDWNEKYQQPYYTHCYLDYKQAANFLPNSYGFCKWAGSWISTLVEIRKKSTSN